MTEQQIKFMCKQLVEYGNKPLTDSQKEIIKQTIDRAQNYNDLLMAAWIYANSH